MSVVRWIDVRFTIDDIIRRYRKTHRLNHKVFAFRLDLDRTRVRNVERRRCNPTIVVAGRLAVAFCAGPHKRLRR